MVNIQYASDLHINDFPKTTPFRHFIVPVAPILVLAGDVCSAWDSHFYTFLAWCSRSWRIVIFVPGNHEYYCDPSTPYTIEETDTHMYRLTSSFPNVVFLQSGASYVLPGTRIRFVGATLWSAISPSIWDEIAGKKGDFKSTFSATHWQVRHTTPADINSRHYFQKAHLASAIAPHYHGETLIVVTHHMPSMQLLEDHYKGEKWCSCYASNSDELLLPNITAWICGHSHRATQWKAPYGGPTVYMNARGYNRPHEMHRTEDLYDTQAVFSVA